jgi:hypothetical protein
VPTYSPTGNKWKPNPSLLFPANFASIDMDAVNDQYFGGVLPDNSNTDDGRLLRQQIVSVNPTFVELADGSLKTYAVTTAVRRSNLHGFFNGADIFNADLQSRTFTNASWTVVGGTVVKDQIGRTGAANSCCRVTLTATTCTITAAAASTDAVAKDRVATIECKQTTGSGGVITLSIDNAATFPALTSKAIPGANARSFLKKRFAAVQNIASPQKQIKITGTIGDVWVLDFSETLDSGTTNPTDVTVEQPPIATTTTAPLRVWRDRPTAGAAGYVGTTIASPANTFLMNAVQAHYFEFWTRRDGSLIASSAGVQISENQTNGCSAFGVQTFTAGVGRLPILTTDLYAPIKNKLMVGQKATETFIVLNDGAVITGAGGSQANTSDHDDWGTNGAGDSRTLGGIFRHVMTTDYDSMKALALAGGTL